MSWHLSGKITSDQDADQRLDDITHEYKKMVPDLVSDIDAAITMAKTAFDRMPSDESTTVSVTLSGHTDDRTKTISANVTSYRE